MIAWQRKRYSAWRISFFNDVIFYLGELYLLFHPLAGHKDHSLLPFPGHWQGREVAHLGPVSTPKGCSSLTLFCYNACPEWSAFIKSHRIVNIVDVMDRKCKWVSDHCRRQLECTLAKYSPTVSCWDGDVSGSGSSTRKRYGKILLKSLAFLLVKTNFVLLWRTITTWLKYSWEFVFIFYLDIMENEASESTGLATTWTLPKVCFLTWKAQSVLFHPLIYPKSYNSCGLARLEPGTGNSIWVFFLGGRESHNLEHNVLHTQVQGTGTPSGAGCGHPVGLNILSQCPPALQSVWVSPHAHSLAGTKRSGIIIVCLKSNFWCRESYIFQHAKRNKPRRLLYWQTLLWKSLLESVLGEVLLSWASGERQTRLCLEQGLMY